MKNWTLFIGAVLLAAVGLTLTANDERDSEKRESRDGDRVERDKPRNGDRERPVQRDRERDDDRHREHAERDHPEANEIERWARQQQHKAQELLKAGRKEEAHELIRHAEEVIAKHRRDRNHHAPHREAEIKKFVGDAERKIHKLLEQGKKKEAEVLRRHMQEELAAIHRQRGHHHEHPGNEERARHIHQAIEHLKAAGLEEFAEELVAHLHHRHHDETKEQENHHRNNHEREEREGHDDRDLEELRNHVHELSHALRKIQEQLEEQRDR